MARQKERPQNNPYKPSLLNEITKGILRENPVFRLLLGICPALAVTTSVENSLGMGIASTFVLLSANLVVSLLRHIIPPKVRIPAFIIIISGFVTVAHMIIQAFLPDLNDSLGIYIPLITVNCIILGRAEIFASKRKPFPSVLDGLGMGIGYTVALVSIGLVREVLGNGAILGFQFISADAYIRPMMIMILPPGGFFVFGILVAFAQRLSERMDTSSNHKGDTDLCAGAINDQTACIICGGCGLGRQAKTAPMDPEQAKHTKRGDAE